MQEIKKCVLTLEGIVALSVYDLFDEAFFFLDSFTRANPNYDFSCLFIQLTISVF